MKMLNLLASVSIALGIMFVGTVNAAQATPTKAKVNAQVMQTVDINTADAKALEGLKGVGAKKAQAIIDYRNKNGVFQSVDDLTKVKGIDKKFVANLQKNNPGLIVVKPVA